MSNTITIELGQDEASGLVELLDVATKAGGLMAARAALPLTDKIMQAIARNQTKETRSVSEDQEETEANTDG